MSEDKTQSYPHRVNDSPAQKVLADISHIPSMAVGPIALPDMHLKEKTEAPASFAAATRATIIPQLTAPSVGCGMGALATSLTQADISEAHLEKFYAEMRRHLGPKYGTVENILLWLGIIRRPRHTYDFSVEELPGVIRTGALAAVHKYQLPLDTINHIEYSGNVMDESTRKEFSLPNILPRSAWVSGLHDIGYGFKGNHFLEVQYIEEIYDAELARAWGLHKDQIIIMYHGGGGAVSHYMGRYFAKRKKMGRKERIFLPVAKALFHFGSWQGIKHAKERWQYYFRPQRFQEIPTDTYEGRRLLASIQASLNYSYAFRIAIAKRITDALEYAFGKDTKATLIWDTIHNSIMPEIIHGERLIVHRHTATRALPGKPVIISGFNTTGSYIGVGMPDAEAHLFSADHGAGETIKRFQKEGKVFPHPKEYQTTIYLTKPPYKKTVSHITDEGVDYVMNELERAGVTRRVIKLRPIAVFKG